MSQRIAFSRICLAGMLLVGGFVFSGCADGSSSVVVNSVTGGWTQSSSHLPGSYLAMTLQESAGKVTGTGTQYVEAGMPYTLQITGSEVGKSLTLNLVTPQGATWTFQGTVTDASDFTGTLTISGSTGSTVTFMKNLVQPLNQ